MPENFSFALCSFIMIPVSEDSPIFAEKRKFCPKRSTTTKVKSALSGLRQFLANERPLKMMKNAFYFTLKALFKLPYSLVNKQLQCTYCPISREVKAIRQSNLVSY